MAGDVFAEVEGQPHPLGVEGGTLGFAVALVVAVQLIGVVPHCASDHGLEPFCLAQLQEDPAVGSHVGTKIVNVSAVIQRKSPPLSAAAPKIRCRRFILCTGTSGCSEEQPCSAAAVKKGAEKVPTPGDPARFQTAADAEVCPGRHPYGQMDCAATAAQRQAAGARRERDEERLSAAKQYPLSKPAPVPGTEHHPVSGAKILPAEPK